MLETFPKVNTQVEGDVFLGSKRMGVLHVKDKIKSEVSVVNHRKTCPRLVDEAETLDRNEEEE